MINNIKGDFINRKTGEEIFTTKQVAKILNVSTEKVLKLFKTGELKGEKTFGSYTYHESAILEYMNR